MAYEAQAIGHALGAGSGQHPQPGGHQVGTGAVTQAEGEATNQVVRSVLDTVVSGSKETDQGSEVATYEGSYVGQSVRDKDGIPAYGQHTMVNTQFLDLLPLWAVYLVTVLLALGAIELGFRLGRWSGMNEDEGGVGAMAGATLALLAFLLAIITGIAVDRFDTRRQLVVEEANAIGTAYLRAGYLAEPYRTESRKLYREYVDMRVAAIDPAQLAAAVARSEEIHNELWQGAETLAQADPSPVVALYIEALNDVIDLHTDRVIAAVTTRISSAIWLLLYGMAILTMLLVGVYNSMQGRRNLIAAVLLVLVFAAVMLLIVDLDRAQEGFIRVNQQALLDLQRQLNAPGP